MRGRGEQGEIVRPAHLLSALYAVTCTTVSLQWDRGTCFSHIIEPIPTTGLPLGYPCSPRPRKRGALHGVSLLLRSEFHIKPRSQNTNRPAILIETRIRCELIVKRHVNPFVDFEIIIKFNHVLDAVVRQLTVAN